MFSLKMPTDETTKCCCTFAVVVAEQRQHWGQGPGIGTVEEKRHLSGNNYLSHPPATSCGRSSRDGCQFAARLSLKPKALFFPLWAELLTKLLTIYSSFFVPRITWEICLAVYHWRYGIVIDTEGTAQKHLLPHLSRTSKVSDLINGTHQLW